MHELAIAEGLLKTVIEKAGEAGAHTVNRIDLVIGENSGVVDDSVSFCFELLAQDTIAAGAELVFRRVPFQLRCRQCGREFALPVDTPWTCPGCGVWDAAVTAGNEFYIESIEVDDEGQGAPEHTGCQSAAGGEKPPVL